MFSKGLFPRGVKRCHSVEMGQEKRKKIRTVRGFTSFSYNISIRVVKIGMVWKTIYSFPNKPWFFTYLQYMSRLLKTLLGKEEIARNEQFILFPQCFQSFGELSAITSNLKLSSANSFSLEEFKICRLGKDQISTNQKTKVICNQ